MREVLAHILTVERAQMHKNEKRIYELFEYERKNFPFTDVQTYMNSDESQPGFIPTIGSKKTKFYYRDHGIFKRPLGEEVDCQITNQSHGVTVYITSLGALLFGRLDSLVASHYGSKFKKIDSMSIKTEIIDAWLNRFIIDGHVDGTMKNHDDNKEALKTPPTVNELYKSLRKISQP